MVHRLCFGEHQLDVFDCCLPFRHGEEENAGTDPFDTERRNQRSNELQAADLSHVEQRRVDFILQGSVCKLHQDSFRNGYLLDNQK